MKKLFFFIFVLASFSIFFNISKIDANVYNLLHIKHPEIFASLQKGFVNRVIFISTDENFATDLAAINQKYQVFSSFQDGVNLDQKFKNDFSNLRIATFDSYDLIMQNPYDFFLQSATQLFDQFSSRILPISQDFFSLSAHSTLLKQNAKIKLDLADNKFYIQDGMQRYFVVFGILQDYYKSSNLMHFYDEVKNNHQILMSGAALFSAYSQQKGNIESLWMSLLTLALTFIFLLFAFKNVKIFYLLLLILFSLVFGVGISFLFLDQIHILTLVMSISLVGMILDFALHFICHYEKVKIKKTLIVSMKKVFLLGFLVSAGGYFLFLFSSLELLYQIAFVSIFSLLGAMLFSYFCIPSLLEGSVFQSSSCFESILNKGLMFLEFLRSCRPLLYGIMVLLACFGIFRLFGDYKTENIKNYASMPISLLQETQEVQRLSGISSPNQILILTKCSFECERDLLGQIKKYTQDYRALSQYLLDFNEQKQVINAFKKASDDKKILSIYTPFALTNIQQYFKEIESLKPQHISNILQNPLCQSFANLYIDEEKRFVFIDTQSDVLQKMQPVMESVAQKYQAEIEVVHLTQAINEGFEEIKQNAVWLKILSLFLVLVILLLCYGFRESMKAISLIFLGVLLVLSLFGFFRIEINLFVIFGLILSSAIGVDYIIFAKNEEVSPILRLKSIICASLTSFISFFILYFSSTYAISTFGLSVSLGLLIMAFLTNLEFNVGETK